MTLEAIWVHGNSVRPEETDPGKLKDFNGVKWSALLGIPSGSGCTFRGVNGTKNNFYFCIPTPLRHNGVGVKLENVFVLFNADRGVTIEEIEVFDGAVPLWNKTGFAVGGNHGTELADNITKWRLNDPKGLTNGGVGIRVLVHFANEGNISFTSAGADFQTID